MTLSGSEDVFKHTSVVSDIYYVFFFCSDVVHTVTTDDEIITTELLKRKDNMATGLHSEYFIRKITMPVYDPEEEVLRAIKREIIIFFFQYVIARFIHCHLTMACCSFFEVTVKQLPVPTRNE